MVKHHFSRFYNWVVKYRYQLLLGAALTVLILPAFTGHGVISNRLFSGSMSLLFFLSIIASDSLKPKQRSNGYVVLAVLLILTWLETAGLESLFVSVIKLFFMIAFFSFIISFLIRFISRSPQINRNVIISSITIYLLIGIVGGSLAFLFFKIYSSAYTFPENIVEPRFLDFIYFNFITMSTVGYGDITPSRPETQTLAYMIAITGHLYVAIIIAMFVGKYLMHRSNAKDENDD